MEIEQTTAVAKIATYEEAREWLEGLVETAKDRTMKRIFPVADFCEPDPSIEPDNRFRSLGFYEMKFQTAEPPGLSSLLAKMIETNDIYLFLPVNRIPRKIKKAMRKRDPGRVFMRTRILKGQIVQPSFKAEDGTMEYNISFNMQPESIL